MAKFLRTTVAALASDIKAFAAVCSPAAGDRIMELHLGGGNVLLVQASGARAALNAAGNGFAAHERSIAKINAGQGTTRGRSTAAEEVVLGREGAANAAGDKPARKPRKGKAEETAPAQSEPAPTTDAAAPAQS
jgi:hypothetical protein